MRGVLALALAATPLPSQGVGPGASVVLVTGEVAAGHWNSGSGVVLAPGVVATNAHVLRGAGRCTVRKELRAWPAMILRVDEARDLALLRVPGLDLPAARLAQESEAQAGRRVQAIGFPGGGDAIRRQGVLTAVWNSRDGRLLQTDAPSAPGCSGGGLFTEDGALLGITTFALLVGPRFHFAVPARWAQQLQEAEPERPRPLAQGDPLIRGFLDAMAEDPTNAEAWEAFTRAWTAAEPGDAEAWLARSHALDRLLRGPGSRTSPDAARLEEGLRASRRALELRPDHARAWNNLGVALDLGNEFAEAESAFQRAVELDADYGLAWLNLGGVRINRKDWTAAAAALQRGLELVPGDAQGWARRAFAESMRGQWAEAVVHYRTALRYQPWQLELWKDFRGACLKARDTDGVRQADARIAELSGR